MRVFREHDVDGNGVLDHDEFVACLKSTDLGLNDAQIQTLNIAADSDKDGMIDYDEFLALAYDTLLHLARDKALRSFDFDALDDSAPQVGSTLFEGEVSVGRRTLSLRVTESVEEGHWLVVDGYDVASESSDEFQARFSEQEVSAALGMSKDDDWVEVANAVAGSLKTVSRTLVIRAAPALLDEEVSIGKRTLRLSARAGSSDSDWLRVSGVDAAGEVWPARFSLSEVVSALGGAAVERNAETAALLAPLLKCVSRTFVLRASH